MGKWKLEIRQSGPKDLLALLELYKHLNPNEGQLEIEQAEDTFAHFQSYSGSAIFLGRYEMKVVTSCTLIVVPNLTRNGAPYGLIENVVTDASYRQRGFGKQILSAAVDAAWKCDCYKIMLMTGSKRPETKKFYLDAGFEQSKTGFQMRRIPVREDRPS